MKVFENFEQNEVSFQERAASAETPKQRIRSPGLVLPVNRGG